MKFFALAATLALALACAGPAATQGLNTLAEEEAVLSGALAIRARVLEEKTGILFGKDWKAKARLEYLHFGNGERAAGQYEVATGDVLFALAQWSELNRNLGKPLRLATPEEVAEDKDFQRIADHELGHALSDMVSRRNGLGPWFTEELKQSLKGPESIGLNVVSEGVGTYFERGGQPEAYKGSGEGWFPGANDPQAAFYTYDMVAYRGGAWLVYDILHLYGERGLIWLIAHPLSLDEKDMRSGAVAYRERALKELSRINYEAPK